MRSAMRRIASQRCSRRVTRAMIDSSSSSEVASRGIAKLSPMSSERAGPRSGTSCSSQLRAKPSRAMTAAARKTGLSAATKASR